MKHILRKTLALFLCAAMGLSLAPAAFAGDFTFPDGTVITDGIAFPDPEVPAPAEALTAVDTAVFEAEGEVFTVPGGTGGAFTIPAGTTRIEEEAFAGCVGMASVTIPASVKEIGSGAFSGCTGLTDVTFNGTSALWEAVTIGEGNDALKTAVIHFPNEGFWLPVTGRFFPDANFRKYVSVVIDTDGDGYLKPGEIAAVEQINCSGTEERHFPIQTLQGIEYFYNLKRLYCVYNELPALTVSANRNLELLYCQNNSLSSLDLTKNARLRVLSASSNSLSTLDLSGNPALETVYAHYNKLKTLDTGKNPELSALYAAYNEITQLNLRSNTKLTGLELSGNRLSALDITGNTKLEKLYLGRNSLQSLNVGYNTLLQVLDCRENALTSLNVSRNTALLDLNVASNALTDLNVSYNTALERLQCYSNRLSYLTLGRNSALRRLNCADNPLSALDISLCAGLLNVISTNTPVIKGTITYYFVDLDSPYLVYDTSVRLTTGTTVNIPITAVNFPDDTFRRGISEFYDKNRDGALSPAELSAVDSMYLSNLGITTLKGIEYFTALTTLRCFNNPALNALDVSALRNLRVLECYGTGIRSLTLTKNPYLRALVYDSTKEQQGNRIIYTKGDCILSFPAGTMLYTN